MIALSLISFLPLPFSPLPSPRINKLVKVLFSTLPGDHRNDFFFVNRIKCRNEIKIFRCDYFRFVCVPRPRCVLINDERISFSRGPGKYVSRLASANSARPCPKACFHFFSRLFLASLIVTWVNVEILNYHSTESTYEPCPCHSAVRKNFLIVSSH